MGGVLHVAAVAAELGELPGAVLGVGLVAATASMARLLAERRPVGVVLVGTAGAFPGSASRAQIPVGTVVVGARLGLGAPAVVLGLGYQPLAPPCLTVDPAIVARLTAAGAVPADVLTQIAITTDPAYAARLAVDWGVEHMETFGAAWACHAVGVPFGVVLGITNRVGPNAHAEWLVHRAGAEAAARAMAVQGWPG